MAFNNNTSPKGQGTNEPDPKKVMPDVANKNSSADDNLDWLKSLDLSPPVQTYSSSKQIKSHQEDTTSFDDIDWLIVSDLKSKIDDSKITGKANTSGTSAGSQTRAQSSIYNDDAPNDDLNLDGLDLLSLSSFSSIDSLESLESLESLDFDDVEEFDIEQLQGDIDDTEIKIRELSQLLDNELDDNFANLDIKPTSETISREANDSFVNLDNWDNGELIVADLSQDFAELPSEEINDDTFNNLDADLLLNANVALNEIDNDYTNDEGFWSAELPSIDNKELHDSVDDVFTNEWSQPDDYPVDDAMWDIPLSVDSSEDLDLSVPLQNKAFDTLSPELAAPELTNDMDWDNIAIADHLTSDMIANDMDWDSDIIADDMDWDSDMIADDMDWDRAKPTLLGSNLESASLDLPLSLDDANQDTPSIPEIPQEALTSRDPQHIPPLLDNFDINNGIEILAPAINDLNISQWDEITASKSSEGFEIDQALGSFLVDNFDLEQFDDSSFIDDNLLGSSNSRITTGLNSFPNKNNEIKAENIDLSEIENFDVSISLTKDTSDVLLNDSYEVDIDDEILANELLNDRTFIQPFASNSITDIDTLVGKEQDLSNDIDDIDPNLSISPSKPTSTSSFDLDMGSDFLDDFELDDPSSHFDDFSDDFSDDFIPSSLSTSLNPPTTPNVHNTPNLSTFAAQEKSIDSQQSPEYPTTNPPPLPFLLPLPPKRELPKQSAPQPPKQSPMERPPAVPRNTAPLSPQPKAISMDEPPQSKKPVKAAIPQTSRGNTAKLRDSIPDLNAIGLEEHDDSNDWSELLDSTNLSDSITTIISSGNLDRTAEAPKWRDNIDDPIRSPVSPAAKQNPVQQQPIPKTSNSLSNAQLAQIEFERIAASAYYSDDSQIEAKPTTTEKIKKLKTSVLPPLSLENIWQDYLRIPAIGLGVIGIVAIIFAIANEPIFNMGLKWGVFKNASGKNFSNADFSGANLENVDFSQANLTGANMEKANLVGANLQEAKLDGVNFTEANLSRTRLVNTSIVRSEFKNAQMNLADLSGANLERSNLVSAKMEGANLTGTKIGTQGKENATKFSPTVLLGWQIVNQPREGRNLSKQNLSGLNLNSANLRRANLSGARLNYTDMTRADLSGANLSSSQVNGANWNGAKLTGANVGGIVFDTNKVPRTDDKTICPDRKNGPCKF